jgi:hypothetical protein
MAMRQRTTGLVALGAGVFFLVLAVLLRFYAVPTLEAVPSDYWTHYTATGTGSVFDARNGTTLTGQALTQDITIKGRTSEPANGAKPPANSVVWDYASELSFATSAPCDTTGSVFTRDQCPVSFSNETVAFDDHTAAVLAWSGDKVDTGPTQHNLAQTHPAGSYISKFPFDMAKKNYNLWDGVSGTAPPAQFVDAETFKGITVYRYVQHIGSAQRPLHLYDEPNLPAALVGDIAQPGKNVPVYYYSTVTALVDPTSGIPVAGDQAISLTAGSLDGTDTNRLTLLDVDLKLDKVQATTSNDVPLYQDAKGTVPVWTSYEDQAVRDAKAADRITLIKNTLPLISLILGLLLLFVGIYLTMRFDGRRAPAGPAPTPAGGPAPDPGHAAAAPANAGPEPDEETTKVLPAAAPAAAEEDPDPATTRARSVAAEEDPATTKARATVKDKPDDET